MTRGEPSNLPLTVIERLLSIKEANRALSIRQVIEQARASADVPEGLVIRRSAVHRLFTRHGLMRKRLDEPTDLDRRRFAFQRAGQLWMSDVKLPLLPTPLTYIHVGNARPERERLRILQLIQQSSRRRAILE